MSDHDQRFKVLLKEFFAEFLTLFFPERAARFDFSAIQWLDKEIFTDPPQGDMRQIDLVAQLALRSAQSGLPEQAVALVHIEIESRDAVETLRRRMFEYYETLRRRHNCPVMPVAVYLRVGLDGIGVDGYEENFDDLDVLRFRYLYVGLPGLDAESYVQGGNWLGVGLSALMRVPRLRRAWLRSEALRRLVIEYQDNDYRRMLLMECVEAYAELDEEQQRVYQEMLQTERYKEIQPMMTTTFEKGVAKGLEEGVAKGLQMGIAQGKLQTIRVLLEHRFGALSDAAQRKLTTFSAEQLDALTLAFDKAKSLEELGI
jgi:hypothetical protein